MDDKAFQDKLNQLIGKLRDLPGVPNEEVDDLVEHAGPGQQRMAGTVQSIKESADHLRLAVKYLIFDLEATRRENDYLRKLLASQRDEEDE